MAGISFGDALYTYSNQSGEFGRLLISGIDGHVSSWGKITDETIEDGRADLLQFRKDCLDLAANGAAYVEIPDRGVMPQTDKRNVNDPWRQQSMRKEFNLE